ncbi:E3 ubiquitin-protein ligase MIB2-like isoform X2 [Pomacea canaliculata]|nr:E3 ubiquitin-protein ligase MIB2-like isoform X2 [Pomacea canaliculata]
MSVGKKVRVLNDEEKVRLLQKGHGGYNAEMRSALGKVGEVIKVDEDGDLVVKINERQWMFNPQCCKPASNEDVNISLFSGSDDSDALTPDLGRNFLKLLAAMAAQRVTEDVHVLVFFKAIAQREEIPALEMLKKNPSLATEQAQGLTPLHLATNRGLLSITRALIAAGANINKIDKDGDTPLIAGMSNIEVAEFLVKEGCDVTIANEKGQTAGHMAAMRGYSSLLKLMLSRGADFNAQDVAGDTPLHDAILKKETSAAEVIISWPKVDIRRRNKKGLSPLHYTALIGAPAITELLLNRDRTIVDEQKDDGFTPLHMCALKGHHEVVQILIEKGKAKLDTRNNRGLTPLHAACLKSHLKTVQLLVQKGADVNSRDNDGDTPLHLTLLSSPMTSMRPGIPFLMMMMMKMMEEANVDEDQCIRVACLLLENGADPTTRNNKRYTPLDLCKSDKVKSAVEKFIENRSEMTRALSDKGTSREPDKCATCLQREPDILFVPCGHRVVCKSCCGNLSLCPHCSSQVKVKFDKNGDKC